MRSRLLTLLLTLIVFAGVYWLTDLYGRALRDTSFLDGWILFAGMALQLLFHVKKAHADRLPGSTTAWLQVHVHVGWFVVLVFALHTQLTLPDTMFEWTLWGLFVVVALSGVIGSYLTSVLPAKLEQHAARLQPEEIPVYRARIAERAERLVTSSVTETGSVVLSELYQGALQDFLLAPRNLLAHLRNSRRPIKRLLFQMSRVDGDLDENNLNRLGELRRLVEAKDVLDFQLAHERALQGWLFVHVPATYGLVVLSILHVVTIYAFRSGVA